MKADLSRPASGMKKKAWPGGQAKSAVQRSGRSGRPRRPLCLTRHPMDGMAGRALNLCRLRTSAPAYRGGLTHTGGVS